MPRDFQQHDWSQQVADDLRDLLSLAVREDLDREQDWTTLALLPDQAQGRCTIVARQAGVLAGLPAVDEVLEVYGRDLRLERLAEDGQPLVPGQQVARLAGSARTLLTAERVVLNLLGRLSGIATLTRRFVESVAGTGARIYDTRKTTPGWRRLEKYAVRQGGGHNHRTGLFDAILIKDNHLALAGAAAGSGPLSPAEAVRRARAFLAALLPAQAGQRLVEVEVDTLAQLDDALSAAPDVVLLDNMCPDKLREAVARRNARAPAVELEASGGVRLETAAAIAATGVERISAGVLTHGAVSLDFGLDWLG